MSFRWRLILLNASIVTFVLLAAGTAVHFATQRLAMVAIENDLRARLERFGRPGRGPGAFGGPGRPGGPGFGPPPGGPGMGGGRRFPENDPQRPRWIRAVPDPAGPPPEPLVDPAAAKNLPADGRFTEVQIDDEPYRVLTTPFVFPDGSPGFAQAAQSLADTQRLLSAQLRILLAMFPASLLLAFVAGSIMAGRALAPVRRVTEAARRLDVEHLGERLPVSGHDELAALAGGFNEMAERLQLTVQERAALTDRLAWSLDRERRFVSDASHELRTPLTRTRLVTSAALSQSNDPEELREALKVVDGSTAYMTHLVNQLLTLARSEEGVREPAPPLDPASAFRDGITMAAGERPLKVDVAEGVRVGLLAHEATQIVTNLVENALRATRARGTVEVRWERAGAMGRLTVVDTGVGIEPEHLPHVADRFYRADASRNRAEGGAGLGLALVREIATARGGTFSIESQTGVGTTVQVQIPLYPPDGTP